MKMDFNTAIKTLQFYLDEESFLQKVESLKDLKHIDLPAFSLLLTKQRDVFFLPEDILFKKGITVFNDDAVVYGIGAEGTFGIKNIIKSSDNLFDNFTSDKIIKSGYWDLFQNCPNIDFLDSILILKRNEESTEEYNLIVIKGPMDKTVTELPAFLSSTKLLREFTYLSTPHSRPPRSEHFLSYRHLEETMKLTWDMKQISIFLGSIWCERNPANLFSRLNLLFDSTVLLAEKKKEFNQTLKVDQENTAMVGIPSNFVISLCGGYARGEYSKTSDLDMLLIHEGNNKQFLQVGETLNNILRFVPNLELCKHENLKNLNFHENSIANILRAFLNGDLTLLERNQREELEKMQKSIEELRGTPFSLEERKDGVSKYCWSIYKSIINMVPIYEKPIGKGAYLRKVINQSTRESLHEIIPTLLRITDFLIDERNSLGENLKVCQPFAWDSTFKKYSALTSLQDVSTILAILGETTFTSSTIDRFKVALEKNFISEEEGEKLIRGYTIFSQLKYKLSDEMPIDALEKANNEMRITIKQVYDSILQNLEIPKSVEPKKTLVYPLLVFSDLHWGLNTKLAKKSLEELQKICAKHQVSSVVIAGDVINIDRVGELEETDSEGISLLNELSQIQRYFRNQQLYLMPGNHDPESFYGKFKEKMERELNIIFLGDRYSDDKVWIEHGDLDFWENFKPPLDEYISTFRHNHELSDQKIIVGHYHRIYEEDASGFYANGTIGKSFSSILVTDDSITLLKSPTEFSFDFDKFAADYSGISNADISINEYIQSNFELIEWNRSTTEIVEKTGSEKKTWIVTERGVPTGVIPHNRVHDLGKLENVQVNDVAFPIHYFFTASQTLKEAWGVFSVTGESILPVINQEKQIIGTLSIFSVPKPEQEHTETKEVEVDEKLKSVGDILTQKLFEKQHKMD